MFEKKKRAGRWAEFGLNEHYEPCIFPPTTGKATPVNDQHLWTAFQVSSTGAPTAALGLFKLALHQGLAYYDRFTLMFFSVIDIFLVQLGFIGENVFRDESPNRNIFMTQRLKELGPVGQA